jgi:hypothetical protein
MATCKPTRSARQSSFDVAEAPVDPIGTSLFDVVEGVGFEPTEGVNPRQFSRLLP